MILLKDFNQTMLYALTAFLNSGFCCKYYQAVSGEVRRVFPQVHLSTVASLRTPKMLCDPTNELTKRLADYIQTLSNIYDNPNVFLNKPINVDILNKIELTVEKMASQLF